MLADDLITALKAAAEPTRLRMLVLLTRAELNVKDLTRILGQSQPRISRHLKLLAEAGLIERVREGSWAYFHLADEARAGWLGRMLADAIDPGDSLVARDLARASSLKQEQVEAAQAFFQAHAGQWDRIRSLHVDETEVEAAIVEALTAEATAAGPGADPTRARQPRELMVDLGTGTGRMLELLAGRFRRAIGIDTSSSMLSYARAKLDRAQLGNVQLRHGDIFNLAIDDGAAGAVVMHQVLHFLADPARAIAEAARILQPGGRLILVDFAPHELAFLRERFAHVRLGFARAEIAQWLADAGLDLVRVLDLVPPGGRESESRPADATTREPAASAATGSGATDKLTVTLWVATRQAARRPAPRRAPAAAVAAAADTAAHEDVA